MVKFDAKTFVIGFIVFIFLLLASGGGLTRADYNSMECYNLHVAKQELKVTKNKIKIKRIKRSIENWSKLCNS